MEQVETHTLTTVRAVVRLLGTGDQGHARRVLLGLMERRRLFRHWAGEPGRSLEYFMPERRPLHSRELREAYSVLAFSVYARHGYPLLGRAQFAKVIGKVAAIAGVGDVPFRPCFLHRARKRDGERLSLIRVGRSMDLQAAVRDLEQFVGSPAFRPWYFLAMSDSLVVSYLLPAAQPLVNELARWVRRRPVFCRLGAQPVLVPVYVYEAKIPA